MQRRGGNGCTGLKRIQTSDWGSSVRSDRKLCHYWFAQELEAYVRRKSIKTTVGGGHLCLFYQQMAALPLLMTTDLLGDTSSLLSVLVVWMVLTLPSEGWHVAQSQPIRPSYLPGLGNGSRIKHLTQRQSSLRYLLLLLQRRSRHGDVSL